MNIVRDKELKAEKGSEKTKTIKEWMPDLKESLGFSKAETFLLCLIIAMGEHDCRTEKEGGEN